MKMIKEALFTTMLILAMSSIVTQCDAQSYQGVAPVICDSSGNCYPLPFYTDGKPANIPDSFQSNFGIDTTQGIAYIYNGEWKNQTPALNSDYAIVTGIIKYDSNGWSVLVDQDHDNIGVDSAKVNNGQITIYYDGQYSHVISAFQCVDETLAAEGVFLGGGYGLNYSQIDGYVHKDYRGVIYCAYNGSEWIVQDYGGGVYTNPTVISWDSTTKILKVGHVPFLHACFSTKSLGNGYGTTETTEYDAGYAYNYTQFRIEDKQGNPKQPLTNYAFMFTRLGKKSDISSQFNNTQNVVRISDWTGFIESQSNSVTNFEFMAVLKRK